MKKVISLVVAIVLTLGLTGCMSPTDKLPEGDVKVAAQKVEGVVNLLLESADYGQNSSSVCSALLPEGTECDVKLYMENYKDGKLENTTDLLNYSTKKIEKNGMIQMIMNVGNGKEGSASKSIYSIAEVDKEKTKDDKNPQYKIEKFNGPAIDYDTKSETTQIGKNFNEELALASYVKFKDGDAEKKAMDMEKYNDELGNYKEAHIIKMKVIKR